MECRLQAICKFCQEEAAPFVLPLVPVVGGGSIKEYPEVELYRCKKCDFTCEEKGVLMYHYRSQHPKEITMTIKERPGATMRHCKHCDFTSTNQGIISQHTRHEHPKAGVAKRTYTPRGGQKTTGMGLDAQKERLEREREVLKINKDADVRHAFDILQARSNDCTLNRAAQKDFDKLEDETADLKGVTEWPTAIRGRVINLYNDVVNGVTEEK